MAKRLTLGFIFILLIGPGCFGTIYINVFKDPRTLATAICITPILLLAAYVVSAFFSTRKKLAREPHNHEDAMRLYVFSSIASLLIAAMAVLLALFNKQIVHFFIEYEKAMKLTISTLFIISIILIIFVHIIFVQVKLKNILNVLAAKLRVTKRNNV